MMILENYIWLWPLLLVLALFVSFIAIRKFRRQKLPANKAKPEIAKEVKDSTLKVEPQLKSLASALSPTRKGWIARLAKSLDSTSGQNSKVIDEVEEILFSADIGVKTSAKLLSLVKERISENQDRSQTLQDISDLVLKVFEKVNAPAIQKNERSLQVVMFVGVNGVGKTTTIGKLAAQLSEEGAKVVLAAGDTFRAAAAEQLEIWATRSGSQIVRGAEGSDPSSVLFDAVNVAKTQNADFVLCDTAGRLHTKSNLMDELRKVHRVLGKGCEGAPHEVLLVVDATTGQNAIEQARQFMAATPLTGVVLTKLDGTAKGGIAIGISDELSIPIRYIGVGEKAGDLRPFSSEEFVTALFENEEGGSND